jgi:hypothetical protein
MNVTQEALLALIHADALEMTQHNAAQVLALYQALAEFVGGIVTMSDEMKTDLHAVESWLFGAMRQGMNRPDMTDDECMRLALGVTEEEADNVVKFERGGLN